MSKTAVFRKNIIFIFFSIFQSWFQFFLQSEILNFNRKHQKKAWNYKNMGQILSCSRCICSKMALFVTIFEIPRYSTTFGQILRQILLILVILLWKKCGEIQANQEKWSFQMVKVDTSESPKYTVLLDEIVQHPNLSTEKLQLTPKPSTGLKYINMAHFETF